MAQGNLAALAPICTATRRFSKGNVILFQGEAPRTGFAVKEGTVRAYTIDDAGNEYNVAFFGPGDIFPLAWLYDERKTVMFYYEAIAPTELLTVERGNFHEKITADAEIGAYVTNLLISDAANSLLRSLALQQPRAKNKIIYFFYYLALRHGKEVASGLYNLGLPLTHQTIANSLGLTRETVATELGALRREGIVAYRNKKYIVDKKLVIHAVGKEINTP